MPEALEAPPAQTQDVSATPTLLESLAASGADLASNPKISGRQLPPIGTEPGGKPTKEEKPPVDDKPPKDDKAKTDEDAEKAEAEKLRKSGEAIADKMFPRRKKDTSKEAAKTDGEKAGTEETDATAPAAPVKPNATKPETQKTVVRKPAPVIDEATITERAAAAATKAALEVTAKTEKQPDKLEKGPEQNLSDKEKRQFVVYKELEEMDPVRYKGVSDRYIKSLTEIQDYVKTWSKDNPGEKFNADAKEHDAFFERVEPEVDEDDWDDAKANIRAREISAKAIAPVTERMQRMERDRAKAALEPVMQSKRLEAAHLLLHHYDPEVATTIQKKDGLKELGEKDPIALSVLSDVTNTVAMLAEEVVKLHDPMGGVEYSPENPVHKEIADFIVGQEKRILALPPEDKERDGKQFTSRLQFQRLPADQRKDYWYLDQDDVIDLLAQKYASRAKKLRDSEVEKFNKTAESLGFKKIEVAKEPAKTPETKPKESPKTKETPPSPEAVSRATTKPTPGATVSATPSQGTAIVGALFPRYKTA